VRLLQVLQLVCLSFPELEFMKYQCSRSWNRASFGPPRVMSTAVHCPGRPRKTRGPVYPGSSCHRISKILMR